MALSSIALLIACAMPATKTLKRPAARAPERPAKGPRAVPGPAFAQEPDGPEHPEWAKRCVDVLLPYLQALTHKTDPNGVLNINLWSDCGGMGTLSSAAEELSKALSELLGVKLHIRVYLLCDKEKHCQVYASDNHAPAHMSHDIFDRDFDAGTYFCAKCDETHALPTNGCVTSNAAM